MKNKKAAPKVAKKVDQFKKKAVKGDKNGKERIVASKASRYYPTEDKSTPLPSHTGKAKPTKLRASITPGTVLILLAGRFRGKRVVCLGQLPSGLLLVTGPFSVNGVPARRVNARYVIATSTKIDVSKVDTSKFGDNAFRRMQADKKKKSEEAFFAANADAKVMPPPAERVAAQKDLDKAVLAAIGGNKMLTGYLGARFTLSNGDKPHAMNF